MGDHPLRGQVRQAGVHHLAQWRGRELWPTINNKEQQQMNTPRKPRRRSTAGDGFSPADHSLAGRFCTLSDRLGAGQTDYPTEHRRQDLCLHLILHPLAPEAAEAAFSG